MSAKRHVAPVMFAVKAGVSRISLKHRASTERDATLFGLCGQPGGRESVNDGDGASRSTRRAENRILVQPTWLARAHRVTSASGNGWTGATGPCVGGIQQGLGHVRNAQNESADVLKRQDVFPKTVR